MNRTILKQFGGYSTQFLKGESIKRKYAYGRPFLAQFAPDEKSKMRRLEIRIFIKVFDMMADR